MVSQFSTRYAVEQCKLDALIYISDSAEEALVLLSRLITNKEGFPNLIFLDLVMPRMGGWEFIERMQQMSGPIKETKIFVLSAFTNSQDRNKAKINPSITGFYDKPITRGMVDSIFISWMV